MTMDPNNFSGLLGGAPQTQSGFGGLLNDPYTLATLARLFTAKRGDNWGMDIANLAMMKEQSRGRKEQQDRERWEYEQRRKQAAKGDQADALAQRAFAPGTPTEVDGVMPDGLMPTRAMQGQGGGMTEYAQGLMQIDPQRAVQFQQAMAKDTPFGKIEPHQYTPESVARFSQTRSYADLMPRTKMEVNNGAVYDPYGVQPGQHITGPTSDVVPDGKGGWTANPAKVQLRQAGATRFNVDQRLENRESADKGALNVKNFGEVQQAAGSARKENALLTFLEKNPIDTSRAAPITTTAAAWLSAAGMGGEQAKRIASNAQQFNAAAMDLVLQKQLAQKGPQTESDARRLEQTVASLGNTKEANSAIIAFSKAANNKTIQQEKHYSDWWKKHRTYEGADDAWINGPGGRSIWDDPTMTRFGASSGPSRQQPQSQREQPSRRSGDRIHWNDLPD